MIRDQRYFSLKTLHPLGCRCNGHYASGCFQISSFRNISFIKCIQLSNITDLFKWPEISFLNSSFQILEDSYFVIRYVYLSCIWHIDLSVNSPRTISVLIWEVWSSTLSVATLILAVYRRISLKSGIFNSICSSYLKEVPKSPDVRGCTIIHNKGFFKKYTVWPTWNSVWPTWKRPP